MDPAQTSEYEQQLLSSSVSKKSDFRTRVEFKEIAIRRNYHSNGIAINFNTDSDDGAYFPDRELETLLVGKEAPVSSDGDDDSSSGGYYDDDDDDDDDDDSANPSVRIVRGSLSSSSGSLSSEDGYVQSQHYDKFIDVIGLNSGCGELQRLYVLSILLSNCNLIDIFERSGSKFLTNLQGNLSSDYRPEIFRTTMRIYRKLFRSDCWHVVSETFVSLIEHLYLIYNSDNNNNNNSNLSIDDYRDIFKIYNLLLRVLCSTVFLNTARIGKHRIESMLGSFVDLLAVANNDQPLSSYAAITPFQIVSCLDVNATWFSILSYNAQTRIALADGLTANINLLENVARSIISWFAGNDNCRFPKVTSARTDRLTSKLVNYATFLSSLGTLRVMCNFKTFQNVLFSHRIGGISVTQCLSETMLTFLSTRHWSLPRLLAQLILQAEVALLNVLPGHITIHQLKNLLANDSYANDSYLFKLLNLHFQTSRSCEASSHIFIQHDLNNLKSSISSSSPVCSSSAVAASKYPKETELNSRSKLTSDRNCSYTTLALLNLTKNKLRTGTTNSGRSLLCILKVADYLLTKPDVYLLLLSRMGFFKGFVESLFNVYSTLVEGNKCKHSILSGFEDLFMVIASSPLGFTVVYRSVIFKGFIVQKMEDKTLLFTDLKWKQAASFFIKESEYSVIFRKFYRDVFGQFTTSLRNIADSETDYETADCSIEQLRFFASVISFHFEGVKLLFYGYCVNESYDISVGPNLTSALDLIRCFEIGLNSSCDHKYHRVILQLLDILTQEFSAIVFLNYHLHYQDRLLHLQRENIHRNTTKATADECSILRSSLLARSCNFSTGGYGDDQVISYLHRPKQFTTAPIQQKKLSKLQMFLQATKHTVRDNNWLSQVRTIYRSAIVNEDIKVNTVLELIEMSNKITTKSADLRRLIISDASRNQKLFPEDYTGITMAIRYGLKQGSLPPVRNNEENLAELVKAIRLYVGKVNLRSFPGYDCFSSTLFIMAAGSLERTLQLTSYIITLPIAVHIWPLATPSHKRKRLIFCQVLEWLLQHEVPTVFHIMQSNGICWWSVCQPQLHNCFWHSMDWINVCYFICFMMLHCPDYLFYFLISVAKLNEENIMLASNEGKLSKTIKEIFHGCKLSDHISCMDKLFNKYHSFITPLVFGNVQHDK